MRSSLASGKSASPPARCIHRPQRDTSSAGYRLLVSRASAGASRELSSRRSPALIPRTCAVSPTFRYSAFLFVAPALADSSSARLTTCDNRATKLPRKHGFYNDSAGSNFPNLYLPDGGHSPPSKKRAAVKTIKNQSGNNTNSNVANTIILFKFHFLKRPMNPKQRHGAKSNNIKIIASMMESFSTQGERDKNAATITKQKKQYKLLWARNGNADAASNR